MQIVEANISDFTVPVTVKIRNMEISDLIAVKFDLKEKSAVLKAINVELKTSKKRYKTRKISDGILVWRKPDDELGQPQIELDNTN